MCKTDMDDLHANILTIIDSNHNTEDYDEDTLRNWT